MHRLLSAITGGELLEQTSGSIWPDRELSARVGCRFHGQVGHNQLELLELVSWLSLLVQAQPFGQSIMHSTA
eukprot:scaffold71329_cov13-Tisochrysis_lutea.AAC.1